MAEGRLEPERYELLENPAYSFAVDRRAFFKVLGAGLVVLGLIDRAEAQESGGGQRNNGRPKMPQELGAWVHIGEDGSVSGFTGKAEVGQNTRTALVQAIAEELRVAPVAVKIVMADTDLVPWDAGTFGSRSMPDMLPQLRRVSAQARDVLLDRAAQMMQVERAGLHSAEGRVSHKPSGKTLSYGEIVKGQTLLKTVPAAPAQLTPTAQWTVLGQPLAHVNGRGIVTGKHRYSSDISLPGMLHGRIVRPPAFGATLTAADLQPAQSLNGVTAVHDGAFLGVAAADEATATKAAQAIQAKWKAPDVPVSDRDLFASLKKTSEPHPNSTRGDIEQGLAAADHKHSATYTVAYIAHAPLEPRSAVAQWQGDKLTVWTGTQRPFGVRTELADAFGIPETRVRVIVPDTGSGYGGKHTGEAAIEAARLARAAGKPVKVVWTREEEFTFAYFRPAGVIDVQSGVRNDGTLCAWDFHNYNSGNSAIATLYEVPHQRVHFHRSESPLRQGSYRGLAATANHFAREIHMDEVALAVGKDPLEFRLQNLKDPRLRAVFEQAAAKFGWGKRPATAGTGYGIGGGFDKGGYVATFAEVSADKDLKRVRVNRVVTAFECGAIVNPVALQHQIDGAVIMGLGGALTEAIRFENGRVLNGRFSRYRVPRQHDVPVIETIMIDRKDLPSAGAGEAPIVGIAPAIGNAIFSATGKRLRSMPLLPVDLNS